MHLAHQSRDGSSRGCKQHRGVNQLGGCPRFQGVEVLFARKECSFRHQRTTGRSTEPLWRFKQSQASGDVLGGYSTGFR